MQTATDAHVSKGCHQPPQPGDWDREAGARVEVEVEVEVSIVAKTATRKLESHGNG